MIKYDIIKQDENPRAAVIKKSNIEVEITLGDSIANLEYNKKSLANLILERKVREAVIVNIDNNHPTIKDLDPETRLAAYMYHEAKKYLEASDATIEKINLANKELEDEIAEIEKQTGLSGEVKVPTVTTLNV